MVFDWFKRTLAQPAPEPEPLSEPQLEPEPEAVAPAEASAAPPDPVEEPVAAPTPASAPAAPAGSGVDEDALAWARQAYARLKAQQEAATPVAASETTPEPESEPAPPTPESAPPTPEPEPPAAPPAGPGLSLLEQAAARRQQRLQEVTAPTAPAAPAVEATATATSTAPPADAADPSLGAFDATFTWSAEVLAAQGRRAEEVSLEEIDWLGRLRRGLEKTRKGFVTQLLENLGDDPLTPAVLDDLESTLLRADVGVKATDQVLEALRRRLNEEVVDAAEGLRFLKEQLRGLLDAPIRAGDTAMLAPQRDKLNVWLLVGVNGVGKTTTLGKLANLAVRSGYSCLIAAADTFRAAAVQQVSVWGERSGVAVVANPSANADPAAVVYDAIGAARSKGTELVLVDTAGRLQTKHNLMEELGKVRRTITKLAPEAVVESLLVLDASQGQNGLRQAMAFASAAGLTGVVLTKLDGSARGGVALAVASEAGLPIRFIGAGEGIRDLRPFNSFEFVEALLAS
ncbi:MULTISPECIES: signal recognition particle-docking protein FtsY [unclassified Cyanobium]|uniref:signal recognition particle-docking protein FtsY n=1 Tax=unclassified Cyanobium TaxID=2627006 RepID=UPI0020CC66B7|nr:MULTISPECIES: signal recognition particle-docking protein FtsY [unclassified Cyanobium]MCP9835657.1 signal recognition particle-docking protein FtsY [Cyanobium sp. La Preciosa 7G6]MCP9938423.1 signal recognition particle-docking protein FtsY [Cyanobium sp. Aljojuca 7A6]